MRAQQIKIIIHLPPYLMFRTPLQILIQLRFGVSANRAGWCAEKMGISAWAPADFSSSAKSSTGLNILFAHTVWALGEVLIDWRNWAAAATPQSGMATLGLRCDGHKKLCNPREEYIAFYGVPTNLLLFFEITKSLDSKVNVFLLECTMNANF